MAPASRSGIFVTFRRAARYLVAVAISVSILSAPGAGERGAPRADTLADDGTWLELAAFIGERYGAAVVQDPVRDALIVIGGGVEKGSTNAADVRAASDVWMLPLTGAPHWVRVTPVGTPPSGRWGRTAIYDAAGDRIILFGGVDYYGTSYYTNEVWALSLSGTPTWTKITTVGTAPVARAGHSAIYDPVRRLMWMFGGMSQPDIHPPTIYSDLWSLDLATSHWSQYTGGLPPAAVYGHSAVLDPSRDRMLICGGNGSLGSKVYALALGAAASGLNAWSEATASGQPPSNRIYHSAIFDVAHDRMVVFGGNAMLNAGPPAPSAPLNDAWALSFAGSPAWTQLAPSGGPPAARYWHSAAYDAAHDRMLVFGGAFATTYTYAFRNETWSLSLGGPGQWSMVLDATGQLRDPYAGGGMIYDPAHDQVVSFGGADPLTALPVSDVWALSRTGTPAWSLLSTTGGPGPRELHNSVYDPVRGRLIVYGGVDSEGTFYHQDVWALDLATHAWEQLTPTGTPPSQRWNFGMVYDPAGDRIVLFGGITAGGDLVDNATYALTLGASPAWSQLTYTGTPPAARVRGMICDPVRNRLVLFGGGASIYDPDFVYVRPLVANGPWTMLQPANSPLATVYTAFYDPARDRMVMYEGRRPSVYALPLATIDAWSKLSPDRGPLGPLPPMDTRQSAYDPTRDQMVVTSGSEVSGSSGGRATLNGTWAMDWGGALAAVPEPKAEARRLALEPPWPNPASGGATIAFRLGAPAQARAEIFDLAGRRVIDLTPNRTLSAGANVLRWDGRDAAGRRVGPGVYLVRVAASGVAGVRRIVIVE